MKPVENKVIAQFIAHVLGLVVAYVVTRYIGDLPADVSAGISAGVSIAAGAAAGWLTKHTPRLEEVIKSALDILGESGSLPGGTDGIPTEPTDVRDSEDDSEMGEVLEEPDVEPAAA